MIAALRQFLISNPVVQSLVGARVYRISAGQIGDGVSYVVLSVSSRRIQMRINGAGDGDIITVRVGCFGRSVAEAIAIRDAVYDSIGRGGISGTMGTATVRRAWWSDEMEKYHQPIDMNEAQLVLTIHYDP